MNKTSHTTISAPTPTPRPTPPTLKQLNHSRVPRCTSGSAVPAYHKPASRVLDPTRSATSSQGPTSPPDKGSGLQPIGCTPAQPPTNRQHKRVHDNCWSSSSMQQRHATIGAACSKERFSTCMPAAWTRPPRFARLYSGQQASPQWGVPPQLRKQDHHQTTLTHRQANRSLPSLHHTPPTTTITSPHTTTTTTTGCRTRRQFQRGLKARAFSSNA